MSVKNEKSVAFFERGSWYHRVKKLNEDYTTSYSKIGGFKTQKEAEKSYEKHKEEYENQLMIHHLNIDKEVYFSNYLIYWFENIFKDRELENTYIVGVAYVIYNFIVPYLRQEDSQRDIKLRLVNASYLDTLLEDVSKITESAGNKCREVLNIAFKDARNSNYIVENPVEDTKTYKRKRPKVKILSKEQLKKLLKYSRYDNWYLEILLGVFCGLRKGEIMGLRFEDFDIENKIMRIRRQLVNDPKISKTTEVNKVKVDKYELVEKPPKKNSYRNLRIPDVIIEELKKRKEEYELYKSKNKEFNKLGYVSFNKDTGNPHIPSSFNTYLSKKCSKIGITCVSVHGLRHMFATILIERGVKLIKISALLGHSSPNTTFEIYCDVMDEREKILEFMNKTFNKDTIMEEM